MRVNGDSTQGIALQFNRVATAQARIGYEC